MEKLTEEDKEWLEKSNQELESLKKLNDEGVNRKADKKKKGKGI